MIIHLKMPSLHVQQKHRSRQPEFLIMHMEGFLCMQRGRMVISTVEKCFQKLSLEVLWGGGLSRTVGMYLGGGGQRWKEQNTQTNISSPVICGNSSRRFGGIQNPGPYSYSAEIKTVQRDETSEGYLCQQRAWILNKGHNDDRQRQLGRLCLYKCMHEWFLLLSPSPTLALVPHSTQ